MNCLGWRVRDSGHNLVPDPPERITGMIDFASTELRVIMVPCRRRRSVFLEAHTINDRIISRKPGEIWS